MLTALAEKADNFAFAVDHFDWGGATNLHADVLSDLAAALSGALAIAPTARLMDTTKRVTAAVIEAIRNVNS